MTYFISDIHGEYDLFLRLLEKINFSERDNMYVLGDMIDKGDKSIALVDFISRMQNVKAILGNHEYDFLKYYDGLMRSAETENDITEALQKLQNRFPDENAALCWETADYIESLPLYVESEEFLCVHAGVETDESGVILPMTSQLPEVAVYNRAFKEKDFFLSANNKTVLFGHTPCSYENGDGRFIKTPKNGVLRPEKLTDYSKIRLDCGVYLTGMLGALRIEDMQEFYVSK